MTPVKGPGGRWLLAGAVAATIALLATCAGTPSVVPPEGFAVYDDPEIVRAVSPEGVRFRVRYEAHEPEQSLEFWREALRRHLERSGYGLLAEESFSAVAGDGALFEWVAPVGTEDWIYLTAVLPAGDRLIIAEAAGPAELYRARRGAIAESLESIGSD
ncbi:MAG: hypothetical protein ACLFNX_01220 [Spirochaetaceae bacterium]